ncbi:hypothetical protein BRC81_13670 [Halobacteriales archaeon QS_1_68_20]|nr:MAG: hypothetical protein BRC81_13670 [Halobacteriales archaeon QS_1_68_20]
MDVCRYSDTLSVFPKTFERGNQPSSVPPPGERVRGRECSPGRHRSNTERATEYVSETAAPEDRPWETLDARELPPPEPLATTLKRLAALEDDVVFVQYNDRAPRHLSPKPDDRGYEYETMETDSTVVTVIWKS